jgi:nitrate/nitrite transporter NarK
MVAASGTLVLVGGFGAFLGPTLLAASMDLFGTEGFFWALATVHTIIGVFILYRMTQRPALPAEEQGTYVAMPSRATMVAGEMYGEAATEESSEPDEDEQAEAGPVISEAR